MRKLLDSLWSVLRSPIDCWERIKTTRSQTIIFWLSLLVFNDICRWIVAPDSTISLSGFPYLRLAGDIFYWLFINVAAALIISLLTTRRPLDDFEEAFIVLVYAYVPLALFGWIPSVYVEAIAFVWTLTLQVIGLKKRLSLSWSRSILSLLATYVVVLGVLALLLFFTLQPQLSAIFEGYR